jgi:hypothetical protein
MKEFKLSAWPDLPPPYQRTTYRRMLSELSLRYSTVPKLVASSGGSRVEARSFLEWLAQRGVLIERDTQQPPALRALAGWLRRRLLPARFAPRG